MGLLRLSVYQVDGLPADAHVSFDFVIDTYQAEAADSLVDKVSYEGYGMTSCDIVWYVYGLLLSPCNHIHTPIHT
ncbi:hypothetical protein EON63_14070 [archaeon]|nr:MAG: hypothetical protein EON63_14070 [archaeon]